MRRDWAKSGAGTTSINAPCPAELTGSVAIVRRCRPSADTSSICPSFCVTRMRASGRKAIAQGESNCATAVVANPPVGAGLEDGDGDGLAPGAGVGAGFCASSPVQAVDAASRAANISGRIIAGASSTEYRNAGQSGQYGHGSAKKLAGGRQRGYIRRAFSYIARCKGLRGSLRGGEKRMSGRSA